MQTIQNATYQQVVKAIKAGHTVVVTAVREWNGFVPDVKIPLELLGNVVAGRDIHGILTPIDTVEASDYFQLHTELPLAVVNPEEASYPDILKLLCERLTTPPVEFKVGDLAVWKDGLSNRGLPSYGQPVVVTEVYNTPLIFESSPESFYFKESLTLKVALIVEAKGGFFEAAVDGRRFRLYDESVDGVYGPEDNLSKEIWGRLVKSSGRKVRA